MLSWENNQRFKICELPFIFWVSQFFCGNVAVFHQLGQLCHKSVFLENTGFGRLWNVYMLLHVQTRLWKSLAIMISKWRKHGANDFETQKLKSSKMCWVSFPTLEFLRKEHLMGLIYIRKSLTIKMADF